MTSTRKAYKSAPQEEQRPKPEAPEPKIDEGLVGFFGHTFTTTDGKPELRYQFRILRPLPPDRWVVEFFSFWDGCPNTLGVFAESYLLSDSVALYASEETWRAGYDKYSRTAR
jgi:hypothetical protein